jgi:hypothetical protein
MSTVATEARCLVANVSRVLVAHSQPTVMSTDEPVHKLLHASTPLVFPRAASVKDNVLLYSVCMLVHFNALFVTPKCPRLLHGCMHCIAAGLQRR